MRRVLVPVLMISFSLLCGCGGGENAGECFARWREKAESAQTVCVEAKLSADLGDERFDCTLRCEKDGDGFRVEVLEPELLSGVCAVTDGRGASVEYDGVSVALGSGLGDGVTPISALPKILGSSLSGFGASYWREKGGESGFTVGKFYLTESSQALLWLDGASSEPVRAEIVSGGKAVIQCVVSDITYT